MVRWSQVQAAWRAFGPVGLGLHALRRALPGDVHVLGVWSCRCRPALPPEPPAGLRIAGTTLEELGPRRAVFVRDKPGVLGQGPPTRWLAAWQDGRLCGLTAWTPLSASDALSHDTWVAAGGRLRGIGRALLLAAAADALREGSHEILWGEVVAWNRASTALLQSLDWQRRGWNLRVAGARRLSWPARTDWPAALRSEGWKRP